MRSLKIPLIRRLDLRPAAMRDPFGWIGEFPRPPKVSESTIRRAGRAGGGRR